MSKKKEQAAKAQEDPLNLELEAPSNKMTIYEYEQKYVRRQSVRGAKFFVRFFAALLGVFLLVVLFFLCRSLYELHPYAGYAGGVVSLLLFIFLFVIPVFKIIHAPYFVTNVNVHTARPAQKHNRKVRHEIADKIIDFTAKVEGVGWYDSEVVGRLAIASKTGNEEELKKVLTELYRGCVKKTAKEMIFKSSLKSATYSALSQTAKIDAALVIIVNIQLIKDIVFLYGFRPSDARLMKIFAAVIRNALIAYGLDGISIGTTVVKSMGDVVKGIPILGSAISALIDSSVQGLANGVLTTVIGYQTIKYLNKEYHLQDILDGIELGETEAELKEACDNLETELKKKKKLAPAV